MMRGTSPMCDPDPKRPDPVNPKTNDMKSPDGNGAGQSLRGTQASSTQIRRGGLSKY